MTAAPDPATVRPPAEQPDPATVGPPVEPSRRRAAANIRPQELAAGRETLEGLAWLRRPPDVRAGLFYRLVRGLARAMVFGVFGFRVRHEGRERLPVGGGYLLLCAVHRGWMDPFLALDALPAAPRVWFLGSGPSAFDRPWKEWLLQRIGGVLPVWRGGLGIDVHVASANAVLERGGIFATFVEGTIGGPPDRPTPFRLGALLIALRTGAPIVPLAVAGTEELHRGKRMATRILAPTTVPALLGVDWTGLPEPGSREELAAARLAAARLEALMAPAIAELWPGTVTPSGAGRRWPWLTGLLLGRPRVTGRGSPPGS
jgi:1-acyl-sn-glycerol-3-phosphate acyltransferase